MTERKMKFSMFKKKNFLSPENFPQKNVKTHLKIISCCNHFNNPYFLHFLKCFYLIFNLILCKWKNNKIEEHKFYTTYLTEEITNTNAEDNMEKWIKMIKGNSQ